MLFVNQLLLHKGLLVENGNAENLAFHKETLKLLMPLKYRKMRGRDNFFHVFGLSKYTANNPNNKICCLKVVVLFIHVYDGAVSVLCYRRPKYDAFISYHNLLTIGPPNSDERCKIPWLRSLLFWLDSLCVAVEYQRSRYKSIWTFVIRTVVYRCHRWPTRGLTCWSIIAIAIDLIILYNW